MKKSHQFQILSLILAGAIAPAAFADGFNDWGGATPMAMASTRTPTTPAGAPSSSMRATYVGTTTASVTVGTGATAQKATATGQIYLGADFSKHALMGKMSGFKSSNADVAKALNSFAPSMTGSFDAAGKFRGTTLVGGKVVGNASGTVSETSASGSWTLVKNTFSVSGSFSATRKGGGRRPK